jgi:outer membrane protein assembly factor BamB
MINKKSIGTALLIAAALAASGCGVLKKGKGAATPVLGQRIAVLTSEGDVAVDPATAALPMVLPEPVANTEWVQSGGTASKSLGHLALGTALARAFTVQAGRGSSLTARLASSPIVANGHVYTIDTLGAVRSFDARTGAQLWASQTPNERGNEVSLYGGGIAYDNGRQVWQDALQRTSIRTSVSSLSDIDADPVIDNGQVFAVGQGGRMVALELTTGQRMWELNIAGIDTPWVAGDWIFVITDDAKLLCISRLNGHIRWINQLPEFIHPKGKKGEIEYSGPVLAGGRLIVTGSTGTVVNIDPTTGSFQSQTTVGAPISLSPVVANSTLYVYDDNGRLTAFR